MDKSCGMSLNEVGLQFGTDKASNHHNYLVLYEMYMPKDYPFKILEIGVQNGASVKTWEKAYPKAQIVGVDIDPECKQFESDRVTIEIADQGDDSRMKGICSKYGPFDFIIDDGSHRQRDMRKTFLNLFNYDKALNPGGWYSVEDLECCYDKFWGGGLKSEGSFVEYVKNHVVDELTHYAWGGTNPFNLCAIHWYPSVVFIRRLFDRWKYFERKTS